MFAAIARFIPKSRKTEEHASLERDADRIVANLASRPRRYAGDADLERDAARIAANLR